MYIKNILPGNEPQSQSLKESLFLSLDPELANLSQQPTHTITKKMLNLLLKDDKSNVQIEAEGINFDIRLV